MKIATVVGARPQFVKAAVVSRQIRARGGLRELLIHTGQHYDDSLSGVFFEELEIPAPDYHLGIGSGTHGRQTGRMLEAIECVLLETRPDCLVVYGDTNSTLAGALAATKLQIPVAHVEAGLRSFDRTMPEEINRVLTDHASELVFAPTKTAVANLLDEGIAKDKIHLVGDVMYDAALYYGAKAESHSCILEKLGLEPRSYVLATVHRAGNTDHPARLRAIFGGLVMVAQQMPVVLPLHPRTRCALEREQMLKEVSRRIRLIEPVGYLDMIMLEKNARVMAVDSGGVQKEAFFYQVGCATLRERTEWVELVEMGWNVLVPPGSAEQVYQGVIAASDLRGISGSPYGDGDAAQKVVTVIETACNAAESGTEESRVGVLES